MSINKIVTAFENGKKQREADMAMIGFDIGLHRSFPPLSEMDREKMRKQHAEYIKKTYGEIPQPTNIIERMVFNEGYKRL